MTGVNALHRPGTHTHTGKEKISFHSVYFSNVARNAGARTLLLLLLLLLAPGAAAEPSQLFWHKVKRLISIFG